jgi:hypothetical protein
MSTVVFDISMSLDGFMTASNRSPEEPLGDGGLKLVEWAMGDDERGRAFLERSVSGLGAAIAGRNTYDDSLPWWGADGPSGDPRRRWRHLLRHTQPSRPGHPRYHHRHLDPNDRCAHRPDRGRDRYAQQLPETDSGSAMRSGPWSV